MRAQLHQRRQKSRERLAGAGRCNQKRGAIVAGLGEQLKLMLARRPAAASEPLPETVRQQVGHFSRKFSLDAGRQCGTTLLAGPPTPQPMNEGAGRCHAFGADSLRPAVTGPPRVRDGTTETLLQPKPPQTRKLERRAAKVQPSYRVQQVDLNAFNPPKSKAPISTEIDADACAGWR